MNNNLKQSAASTSNSGFTILLIPLLALLLLAVFFYTARQYYPDLLTRGIDWVGQTFQKRVPEHPPREMKPSQDDIEQAIGNVLAEREAIKQFGLPVRINETYLITLNTGATFVANNTRITESEISFTDTSGLLISLNRNSIQSITRIKKAQAKTKK